MDNPTSTLFGNAQALTHEEISRRAQELWEQYGRPTGRDEDIWLEAERQLRTTTATSSSPAARPAERLNDGTIAPAMKSAAAPAASTPTTISSTPKPPRAGGKKKPGGGAK
jgi:hypothetical protein